MGPRPNNLTLNSDDMERANTPQPPKSPYHMDLPSPRTGEIPPALSPLDAFAMHSRLLAKRFEEPKGDGRRISRLPHTDVARELASRPGYFRSVSNESERDGVGELPQVREEASPTSPPRNKGLLGGDSEKDRPKSHYPMFGNAAPPPQPRRQTPTPTPFFDAAEELPSGGSQDYFGVAVPRATSPEPVDKKSINVQVATPPYMPSLTNSVDSIQSNPQPRTLTDGSTQSQRSLAPPRSPAMPKSPRSMQSIRSVPPDSGDEDGSANGSHAVSSSRKFSGSSGLSRPQSPFSPFIPSRHRSPSMTSEYSMNGSSRRTNFSRPLSSGSNRQQPEPRPSFDSKSSFEARPSTDFARQHRPKASVSTQASSAQASSGAPSRQGSGDETTPPYTLGNSPAPPFANAEDSDSRPSTSYTYAKFALPRGRTVDRDGQASPDSWVQNQSASDLAGEAPLAQASQAGDVQQEERPPMPPMPRKESPAASASRQERVGRNRAASTAANRSRSAEPGTVQKAAAIHKSTPSVKTHDTDSTDRTIKATPLHQRSPSAELTAEEHLEIGIQTHDSGQLSKSTYHLRIAARGGSATGMLLYALACRHGWGMRPNQEEGVRWLKKAIDGAGLEVADVEQTLAAATNSGGNPHAQAQERKKRKAQFALAIYELGISYMNGWGCAKDKPLAVQCYEVAGSWGDCDALAEAGFCYAQGTGCKKDLHKAAALYRKAADGGMSMAGNSWIYKPKYMDDTDAKNSTRERKTLDPPATLSKDAANNHKDAHKESGKSSGGRARSRSIWGRSRKA